MTDDTPLRLLVLMRHAHAKGHSLHGDAGRELSKRGREQAREVGQWLVREGVRPDVVVMSSAVRTMQTWEQVHRSGVSAADIRRDDLIYNAHVDDLLEVISMTPETARTVLVIGHAPGIPAVASLVEDHTNPDDPRLTTARTWPTATVAVVSHRGPWSQFPGEATAVAALHTPDEA